MIELPDFVSKQWKHPPEPLLIMFRNTDFELQHSIDLGTAEQSVRLGEQPVIDIVSKNRHEPTATILKRVFDALRAHIGDSARPDDLALVIVRN